MKILIMAGFTRSIAGFRGDLVRAMIARGHTVVACAPEEDETSEVAALGARFIPLLFKRTGLNPFAEFRLIAMYKKLIAKEKPDVLFTYTIKPNVYGPPAAKSVGVPRLYSMVTGLGNAFITDGSLKKAALKMISTFLYRRSSRCCDKVIFQNPDDMGDFVKMKILRKESTALVNGSGINMEAFVQSPLPEKPVFLMVSRLLHEKGVMVYLDACRLYRQKGGMAECALLGPYEAHSNAITPDMLQPYLDDGSVQYWGATEDVRPYLAKASVLVLPSYREGTPRTMLEAMATGRAVITSDAPGCRETVIHGKTGFMVPVGNPEAVAETMATLASSPGKVEAMGKAGYAFCKGKYDVHLVNAAMLDIMGL